MVKPEVLRKLIGNQDMKSISTFLMFIGDHAGKAEDAITLYTSLFTDSEIISIERYSESDGQPPGFIKQAKFTLNGCLYMASENAGDHQFTFTPAMSLFVECESLEEIEQNYRELSRNGQELMPLDNYGFSQRFGWLNDQYGVSWQLNLS